MSQYSLIKKAQTPAFLFLVILLAGCDEPAPQASQAPGTAGISREVAIADRPWLDVKDDVTPQLWLASRELGRNAPDGAKEIGELRAILLEADRRYYEDTRMIANRAVQVEQMLAENGIEESARSVIESLSGIAEPQERAGFGETCQHYVMARIQGATRTAALDTLRRTGLPKPAEGAAPR